MPDDINGNYSLPNGYLAVTGEKVLPSNHNPPLEDIATALTARYSRDGRAPLLGNMNANSNKIYGLGNGTDPGDAVNKGQLDGIFNSVNTFTKTQVWSKGADIASASALTLGDDGNYFDVTGTTAITSINTVGVGAVIKLHFDAALTLTHHATDLILPGGANITTAAGDEAEFVEYAAGDWRCVKYQRAAYSTRISKAHLTDTKAQNTASQSLASATWNVRHINTENYDPDGIVSISSNQFTLASGSDYSVLATIANANNGTTVTNSYARIYNVTDGVPVQNLVYAGNSNANNVYGAIVLTAVLVGGKTYRIEHNVSGSGVAIPGANQAGMSEVYLSLMIERLTNGFA